MFLPISYILGHLIHIKGQGQVVRLMRGVGTRVLMGVGVLGAEMVLVGLGGPQRERLGRGCQAAAEWGGV